ncbi:hypothetical protein [Selenihalanaerobacter shriftii]|uniref:Uncharacterized protein n=1 Tax=Selenihalanaerobacter shriftii TaxID=142842 RepID=A0A1T4Q118_9FIRM|nr:hypothetical protein [Selenihalanaerobacter shriftii]SJZ97211.1 hypothetical protein SAMN02745118_02379 [Selenihalanaerobacter shriftii]
MNNDQYRSRRKSSKKKIWFKDVNPKNNKSTTNQNEDNNNSLDNKNTNEELEQYDKTDDQNENQTNNNDKLINNESESNNSSNNNNNIEELTNIKDDHSLNISSNRNPKLNIDNKISHLNQVGYSFQQQLLNHLGDFIKIAVTTCCDDGCFEGILCQVESDFIILINSLTIIEIPVDRIAAIIIQAGGVPQESNNDNTEE